jgi:hypothetical protein
MKFKRRTRIILEKTRRISIKVTGKSNRFFCFICREQNEMISINEAASRRRETWREIVRQIENGEIHSIETVNGEIHVCAESISKNNQGEYKK